MRREEQLPELLAPAGSYEAMLAAVEAGADAVYMGGPAFGARAYAKNFDEAGIADATRYCHLHGVRVYVTVNTLLYDRELDEAVDFCRRLYTMGVDAVICADLGLVSRLRRELPELPLHASTQMSLHSTEGVRAAAALGIGRAVVARELSMADVRSVVEHSPLPIEVFVHGALCVCHSGQCLFSSLVGGRSGNRGACAQPCRLPYGGEGTYPLSLKDLSLAHYIPELIDAGVASLKIEGRMKSAAYVLGVTRIYRRLLDERRASTREEDKQLSDLFSRGGFTDAYWRGTPEAPMTGTRREADKERTRKAEEELSLTPRRLAVRAEAAFRRGEPCSLTLMANGRRVTVSGAVPQAAENAPLKRDDLTTRLCKMGNTYLSLAPEDVSLVLEDGSFLPPSAVNALRRAAADAFVDTSRTPPPSVAPATDAPPYAPHLRRTAQLFDATLIEQLPARVTDGFDMLFLPLMSYTSSAVARGVSVPPVVTDGEWETMIAALARAKTLGATHALVGNLGHIAPVRAAGLIPVGDFRLNICNGASAALYRTLGVGDYLLSPELTLPMARDIGGGVITCGRVPLMLTERCFIRPSGGCERCGSFSLTDRRGKRFPIRREHAHRNIIFNSALTYMGDRRGDLRRAGVCHEHMLLTVEDASAAIRLIDAYRAGESITGDIRRV